MKRLINTITLTLIFAILPLAASAVTEKEMEQARTLATQAYLRYANDGSGYLDDLHPKTMAELEKNLKAKEKENIKAFKAIPVPNDFASWDKQKLVEYWGVKAFSTKGLLEKGRLGRNRAKRNISAMTIAAPKKEEPAANANNNASGTPKEEPAKGTEANATQATVDTGTPATETADSAATNAIARADAAAEAVSQLEEDPEIKKADNHTWVYIIILCILVGVVCALVVFASNVMKKNEAAARNDKSAKGFDVCSDSNANSMREKFAATLTAKNEEIRTLSKKIESLNAQNTSLKVNLESLTAEAASLRSRLAEANKKITDIQNAASTAATSLPQAERQVQSEPVAEEPQPRLQTPAQPQPTPAQQPRQSAQTGSHLRTIYLGRANSRGIFVRADRSLNVGNSIYRLDTNDGYAGSFRVANDPTVWEMALLTPRESLTGACVITDSDNTAGMTRIVNDSAGTAIFEGGCWKVIRKAKVHFE